ncbi:MAG: ABC transporter permease [Treponema sp.]|nr:ABC transporter permease [Treponema sp.]
MKTIKGKQLLQGEWGLLLILVVLCLVFSFLSATFSSLSNLLNITRQVSIVLIISIGMLCVVLCGEIDLSVGSTAALVGVGCAVTLKATGSLPLALLVTLVLSLAAGTVNGALTVFGKIPSFIVTLASMWIIRGIALVWTSGRAVSGLPKGFAFLGAGHIGIIPVSTILCLLLILIAFFILHQTRHGVYFRAIGSNLEASKLSAIPIKKYKMIAFIIAGLMSGIGGLITTSKLLSAQAIANEGMEMDVLAAVILGGASLSGGIGTVIGTVLGALIIGVINNGMNQLGISAFYQQIVKGSIIIIAVLVRRNKDK